MRVVFVIWMFIAFAPQAASAAMAHDLRGSWQVTDQCPSGCQYTSYTDVLDITSIDLSSGSFSGSYGPANSAATATITGSTGGDAVTIDLADIGISYTEQYKGQISSDGASMAGTWTDSEGHSGTWSASRVGPEAQWLFDEGSGTTAADSTGHGHTGTLIGGVSWVPTQTSTGLKFDGSSGFVQAPDSASLWPGAGSFTVSATIKTTSQDPVYQWIVSHYACGGSCTAPAGCATAAGLYALAVAGGKAELLTRNCNNVNDPPNALVGQTTVSDGQFHQVTGVRDMAQGQVRLYVDGHLDASAPLAAGINDGPIGGSGDNPVLIGARQGVYTEQAPESNFFSGTIDDVTYYNAAVVPSTTVSTTASLASACPPGDAKPFHVGEIGDALNAQHVAVIVPGVQNNYGTFPTLLGYARNVSNEIRRLYGSGSGTVAVIAWLGYVPPDGKTLPEAATSRYAKAGAQNLARFVRCLQAHSNAPGFSLTVVGHSYGSTVVGRAAAAGALDGDNVVFVGSPGVDAQNVDQLGHPAAVYAGENPNDFIHLFTLQAVQDLSAGLRVTSIGAQALCKALVDQFAAFAKAWDLCGHGVYLAHGPDPTSRGFGARVFSTAGECGHGYFDDNGGHGTEGLANLARITMGYGATVSRETRPEVPPFVFGYSTIPFAPFPLNEVAVPTDVTILWHITCKAGQPEHSVGQQVSQAVSNDALNAVVGAESGFLRLAPLAGLARETSVERRLDSHLTGSVALSATASRREEIRMTLIATTSGRHTTTRPAYVVIATGPQRPRHAGRTIVRLAVTATGRRYLRTRLRAARHRTTKIRLVLVVSVTAGRHDGFFAGPITAQI